MEIILVCLLGFFVLPQSASAQIQGASQGINSAQGDSQYVNVTGDTMSGPLTLSGSSLTVTGNAWVKSASDPEVKIETLGGASNGAWLKLKSPSSEWDWTTNRADLFGAADTLGLYNGGPSAGTTRMRATFSPTGLSLPDSLVVTGSAFSVGGSTLVVTGGKVGVGTNAPDRVFSVFMASGSYANFGSTVAVGHNSGILLGYFDPTVPLSYNKAAIIFKRSGGSGEGSLNIALNNINDPSNATIDNVTTTFLPNGNVGIAVTDPGAKLEVAAGDIAISTQGNGLILQATDGATCYRLTVNNAGTLATTSVTCP